MRCDHDKMIAERRGCNGSPATEPVEEEIYKGVQIQYYHCPRQLIPKSVLVWYNVRSKFLKYPNIQINGLSGMSYRYWLFEDFYEMFVTEFKTEKGIDLERKRNG